MDEIFSQRYFTNGLLAISMTIGVLDLRDLLVVLPLYCDVQKKNNLSFDAILKQDYKFTPILRDFINRDEIDKSLKCMGYFLEIDANGNSTYQRAW